VPEEDHERTLLYYGDAAEMRDILRMHNIYTGYVYLVDGEFNNNCLHSVWFLHKLSTSTC
jgi:hypothetical protein